MLIRKIWIDASTICQLKCPTCISTNCSTETSFGKGFLSASDFEQVIKMNPSIKEVELSNFGEICLNPELPKIIEIAYKNKIRITALNGINFNHASEELIASFVKYKVYAISISLDGASQKTYKRYRKNGNFDNVINNIKKLNKYKNEFKSNYPKLNWQFVIFGHNEDEIEKAQMYAKKLNMTFKPKLSWDSKISPIKNPAKVEQITGLDCTSREESLEKKSANYMDWACHQLWETPVINWDGKILGCCINSSGDFGHDFFNRGLKNLSKIEKLQQAKRALLGEQKMPPNAPCASCSVYLDRIQKKSRLKRGFIRKAKFFFKALL